MNNFNSGTYENQGHYNSFSPNPINHQWYIDDMEIISLLSKADRMLGRLDMYSEHIPNIELFISMHIMKEATQSSKYKLISEMERLGLLVEATGGKRGKVYVLQNYFNIFNREIKYE